MQYYAHSNGTNDKNKWQTLEEHLMNVAELTEEFASKFGVNGIGYNIGLFHDIGKSQENMIKDCLVKILKLYTHLVEHKFLKSICLINSY